MDESAFLLTVAQVAENASERAIERTLKELGIKPKTRKSKYNIHYASYISGKSMATIKKAVQENKVIGEKVGARWQIDRDSFEHYFNLI